MYSAITVVTLSVFFYLISSIVIGPEINAASRKDAAEKKFFADTQEIQKSTAPNKLALVQQLQEQYARDVDQIQVDITAHSRKKVMYPIIAVLVILSSGVLAYYFPFKKNWV